MDQKNWIVRSRHACKVAGDDYIVGSDFTMDDIQGLKHHALGLLDSCSGRRSQAKTNEGTVRIWKKFCSHPRNIEIQKRQGCRQVDDRERPSQPQYDSKVASVRRSQTAK